MRGKIAVAVFGVAAVAIYIWLLPKRLPHEGGDRSSSERVVSIAHSTPPKNEARQTPDSEAGVPSVKVAPGQPLDVMPGPTSVSWDSSLQFTNVPPMAVIDHLRNVFHQYASMFGGNPVGTNPEITAALHGGNPKGADFIDPEAGMRIDSQGDLIDPWGTPYFFHQLSGQEMEIHCAGPDRKMWTADDIVVK